MARKYLEIQGKSDLSLSNFLDSNYPTKFFKVLGNPIEQELILQEESHYLIGVDEAGRGPVAGPVTAAACLLGSSNLEESALHSLHDSKKLKESQREELFPILQSVSLGWGISSASAQEIDELNILNATFLAMRRAIEICLTQMTQAQLPLKPILLLVDGNQLIRELLAHSQGFELTQQPVIQGDGQFASISAASVLAKVSRDHEMLKLSELYPEYDLAQNKGYPSPKHIEALRVKGRSVIHRQSFHIKALDELDLFGV